MGIQIDPHTLERAEERGTNEAEIEDVITTGFPFRPSMDGREEARSTPLENCEGVDSTNKSE